MEGIGFNNMKLLKDYQWFDFTNITLLTGTNNSGKSSIINAMQMLQENISGNTMDDLLKTEFKVKANQTKYGSIESFVSNDAMGEDSYFVFARRFKTFEYKFRVDINKGLESYGSVKAINVIDINSNEVIFNLNINSFQTEYLFNFKINYKYFVNRFYEKCKKTEILLKRKKELDRLLKLVNKGAKSVEDLKSLAEEISREVSVYIIVYPASNSDDTSGLNEQYTYEVTNDEELILTDFPECKILEEVKVFFDRTRRNEKNLPFTGLMKNDKYKNTFGGAFKWGVFDFTQLWETDPHIKENFEEIVCPYYKRDLEESCQLLCDDLLTVVSNTKWEMITMETDEEIWNDGVNVLEEAFLALPDIGLIAKMLIVDQERNSVVGNIIEANATIDFDSESMKHLVDAKFFDEVYDKLTQLLYSVYKDDSDYVKRKKLINPDVFNEINSDISQKLLKKNLRLDNVYVSSNRFTIRRSHSFNDSTDFAKLLKNVEGLKMSIKESCYTFINKWLNEFDLADELILKSDQETGDFKAYLRNGDMLTVLADYGLGTNQILPIIFAVGIHDFYFGKHWERLVPRVVVIEEPEANLHPALQSKLADMFVEANEKFQVKIIVETHSEYLIRKLQYLVASPKSDVKPVDVVIYYFYKPNSLEVLEGRANQVERIEIDKFGRLNKRFGDGFYDEADKIAINLFLLSKDQAN